MGILNVTPDSFSDGGKFNHPPSALAQALRMVDEGASIIDIGGESTRPGAARIDPEEQIRRTRPILEALRQKCDVLISIDTTRAKVAEAALQAGANIINDVSAGQEDKAMFPLAADHQCGLILMHRRLPPEKDSYSDQYKTPPTYEDVLKTVRDFLEIRAEAAIATGVNRESIVLDPGLGFGKTVAQNYEIMARIRELMDLGYPVLSAASRKSFLGAVGGKEKPEDRLAESIAASGEQFLAGVRLFRVHDVIAHTEMFRVLQRIEQARQSLDSSLP